MPRTKELKRKRHSIYSLRYHIVWIPKYRKELLKRGIKERLKEILHEIAGEHGWGILELAIEPDHVHLFVETHPSDSPSNIVKAFKGRSSKELREEFSWLRRYPALWTPSFYVGSVGHVSSATVQRYIAEQGS